MTSGTYEVADTNFEARAARLYSAIQQKTSSVQAMLEIHKQEKLLFEVCDALMVNNMSAEL